MVEKTENTANSNALREAQLLRIQRAQNRNPSGQLSVMPPDPQDQATNDEDKMIGGIPWRDLKVIMEDPQF